MNAYSICVIICVQMWCVYLIAWWSNPKIFLSILKVFLCFCMFRVFPNYPFHFLLKNSFRGIFTSKNLPTIMRKTISVFSEIYIEFHDYFPNRSYSQNLSRHFRGHFTSNFARSLLVKWAVLQSLKPNSDRFSNISFLPPPFLSQPRTFSLSKSLPKLKINPS